jgi:hypothetical protein
MSERYSTLGNIFGEGLPRLIRLFARPSGWIVSNTADDGTSLTVITILPHGLAPGQRIRFVIESDSDDLTGDVTVLTIVDDYTFTCHIAGAGADTGGFFEALIDTYESTGNTTYTTTSVTESGSPSLVSIHANMRISSKVVTGSLEEITWAKVLGVNDSTDMIVVDSWSNGTPTNNQKFRIDGLICDLPRCQEMTEFRQQDILKHSLYRGDSGSKVKVKYRGYKYQCKLDYSKFASGDFLYDLMELISPQPNDQFVLIPRRDIPQLQYNVYFEEGFELSRYGKSPGYRKPVFVFNGCENIADLSFRDGYGKSYATAYGTGL